MLNYSLIDLLKNSFSLHNSNAIESVAQTRNAIYNGDPFLISQKLDEKLSEKEIKGGKFIKEVDGIPFSCFLAKGSSKTLHIIYNGGHRVPYDYLNSPLIPRWSYHNLVSGYLLGIDDPMNWKYPNLMLGWYYGDENVFYLKLSLKIVEYVCDKYQINYDQCTFMSSSGGGYAALMASALWPNSLSISFNPQIYIQNYPYANEFKRITGIDLSMPDIFKRNAIHEILINSRSKHVIITNIRAEHDIQKHLKPLLNNFNIDIKYGLSQFKNFLFWLYDAMGAPNAHTAYETKYIYVYIEYISQKFKGDPNFKISDYDGMVLLINELWYDLYDKLHQLMIVNKRQLDFAWHKGINEICLSFDREYHNIHIKATKRRFNFYKIEGFVNNNIYEIELRDIRSKTLSQFTCGIYDTKDQKIIKYADYDITDDVKFTFTLGSNAEGLIFCIYAGLCGHTEDHELFIKCVLIYKCEI